MQESLAGTIAAIANLRSRRCAFWLFMFRFALLFASLFALLRPQWHLRKIEGAAV
ncbi:MAG: hypothetical protein HC925_03410 [Coleofasciculaceae cyanobacterium SM2_3_26]|nr:hypothetical protein [Coleofasciculaceae cyanobacterium SM2_3_26]